jgi:DNA-binding ferritin-like protein
MTEPTAPAREAVLSELVDLAMQVKQAHWKVPQSPLHEELDALMVACRQWLGELMDRLASLGESPLGPVTTVAGRRMPPMFPAGPVAEGDVLSFFLEHLAGAAARTGEHLERVRGTDPDAEKLLAEILDGLAAHQARVRALAG